MKYFKILILSGENILNDNTNTHNTLSKYEIRFLLKNFPSTWTLAFNTDENKSYNFTCKFIGFSRIDNSPMFNVLYNNELPDALPVQKIVFSQNISDNSVIYLYGESISITKIPFNDAICGGFTPISEDDNKAIEFINRFYTNFDI